MLKHFQILLLIVFLCSTVFLGGCAEQVNLVRASDQPPPVEEALKNFAYDKKPFEAKMEVAEDLGGYELIKVTYPAYFRDDPDNLEVTAWYYRQKGRGPVAGLLQIPILGGDYGPSKLFASFYARQGFHVLRFERKAVLFDEELGLEATRRTIIASVIDMRRGLDWWETLPEVNAAHIGVSGISMGGFLGSLLMAADQRIAAGALMLNGGDLAKILMFSEEEELVEIREGLRRKHGWDDQRLFEEASRALDDVDPVALAPRLNPDIILHIPARFDRVVPWELSSRWWEAAHRPKRIAVPTGHYSAVNFLHYIRWRCVHHFRQMFGME